MVLLILQPPDKKTFLIVLAAMVAGGSAFLLAVAGAFGEGQVYRFVFWVGLLTLIGTSVQALYFSCQVWAYGFKPEDQRGLYPPEAEAPGMIGNQQQQVIYMQDLGDGRGPVQVASIMQNPGQMPPTFGNAGAMVPAGGYYGDSTMNTGGYRNSPMTGGMQQGYGRQPMAGSIMTAPPAGVQDQGIQQGIPVANHLNCSNQQPNYSNPPNSYDQQPIYDPYNVGKPGSGGGYQNMD